MYVEIIFPLPFRKSFTYRVPEDLELSAKMGVRAVAPFGKRTLTLLKHQLKKKSNLFTMY